MASFTKQSSNSGKPKLGRSNALKITGDYDPSSPTASASSSRRSSNQFEPHDLDTSSRRTATEFEDSYRLTGYDSKSQILKLCEDLGLSGGADAFAIPADAWEAGKSRSPSLNRSLFDPDARSRSLDEKATRFFEDKELAGEQRGADEPELPRRGNSYHEVHYRSGSDSLSSSSSIFSTDSFCSDTSSYAADNSMCLTEERTAPSARQGDATNTRHADTSVARRMVPEIDRISRDLEELMREPICPPPVGTKSPLHQESSHAILTSDKTKDDSDDKANLDNTSQSASTGNEVSVSEEKLEVFVSKVVQQQSVSTKESTPGIVESPSSVSSHTHFINLNSWRKLDMLGSGSFGTVYEGLSEDGAYFAVKEVSLSENDTKAQQCVSQLEQEIEVLSNFQHENIVRYLGTQKVPDKLYIFLELVTKGSLSSLYQKYPLFESQIRIYTRQILNGLKYLHDQHIMHRDIKCANILVDVNGKIKLADFGLARQISQLDELKSCKGSAYWMAPEVINPRMTYSFPADIWSLGCTVLEMETRRPPFGDMEWHRALWKVGHGEPPPIPETLSDDAKDFISTCLEVDPAKRPSAAELLKHPFVQYLGGSGFTPNSSFSQEPAELKILDGI